MDVKYSELLKDPRWQKKRLEILQRDNWTCQLCFDNESTLHIHHKRYLIDRKPWDYPDNLLITLCESCHELEMENINNNCDSLIEQIRDKFLAEDIQELDIGFHNLELPHQHDVTAKMICWVLSNPKLIRNLLDSYFIELQKKAK